MAFVQGPETYLNQLGIHLACAVDSSREAILDEAHRAFVNYEAYYFSSDEAKRTFAAAPYRYTGKVTDPVSRERFIPTAESPSRTFNGRLFYFETDTTVAAFDANRDKYGTPMPMMMEEKKDSSP